MNLVAVSVPVRLVVQSSRARSSGTALLHSLDLDGVPKIVSDAKSTQPKIQASLLLLNTYM